MSHQLTGISVEVASGKSYSAIADYLNKNNIPPKHGLKWYHRSVKLVLGK